MTNAVSGIGTVFNRWSGTAFVKLAEITSITGPGMSRETIDVTSFDSTGGYREFIGSLRDAGTLELSMIFSRDTYELLKADFEAESTGNYQIKLPDDEETNFDIEGLVTDLPLTVSMDDKITCDVTIKITGSVDVTSGGLSTVT